MATVLVSGSSGSGRGYCLVILSKKLYCLHPGVLIGTGTLNAGGNPAMAWYPIHGGVEILLVNRFILQKLGYF